MLGTYFQMDVKYTSSHCIAVVNRWAMKIAVRLLANDRRDVRISPSVELSKALVASSQSLLRQKKPVQEFKCISIQVYPCNCSLKYIEIIALHYNGILSHKRISEECK